MCISNTPPVHFTERFRRAYKLGVEGGIVYQPDQKQKYAKTNSDMEESEYRLERQIRIVREICALCALSCEQPPPKGIKCHYSSRWTSTENYDMPMTIPISFVVIAIAPFS